MKTLEELVILKRKYPEMWDLAKKLAKEVDEHIDDYVDVDELTIREFENLMVNKQ